MRAAPWRGSALVALFLVSASAGVAAREPGDVWLMDGRVALEVFDCAGLACGRIAWLSVPRDGAGDADHDGRDPDPGLHRRALCELTVLWGMRPVGVGRWDDGWFYNPDDGKTYRVSAELASPTTLVARIYMGIPLFGTTKTLTRTARAATGSC